MILEKITKYIQGNSSSKQCKRHSQPWRDAYHKKYKPKDNKNKKSRGFETPSYMDDLPVVDMDEVIEAGTTIHPLVEAIKGVKEAIIPLFADLLVVLDAILRLESHATLFLCPQNLPTTRNIFSNTNRSLRELGSIHCRNPYGSRLVWTPTKV